MGSINSSISRVKIKQDGPSKGRGHYQGNKFSETAFKNKSKEKADSPDEEQVNSASNVIPGTCISEHDISHTTSTQITSNEAMKTDENSDEANTKDMTKEIEKHNGQLTETNELEQSDQKKSSGELTSGNQPDEDYTIIKQERDNKEEETFNEREKKIEQEKQGNFDDMEDGSKNKADSKQQSTVPTEKPDPQSSLLENSTSQNNETSNQTRNEYSETGRSQSHREDNMSKAEVDKKSYQNTQNLPEVENPKQENTQSEQRSANVNDDDVTEPDEATCEDNSQQDPNAESDRTCRSADTQAKVNHNSGLSNGQDKEKEETIPCDNGVFVNWDNENDEDKERHTLRNDTDSDAADNQTTSNHNSNLPNEFQEENKQRKERKGIDFPLDKKTERKTDSDNTKPITDLPAGTTGTGTSGQEEGVKAAVNVIQQEDNYLNANLEFYQNKIRSRPDPGHSITEMLGWYGNFDKLEKNHRYIQWLFPLHEGSGMNPDAQALQEHEAEAIRTDPVLRGRVLDAFRMMLHFYGMELTDEKPPKFKRADRIWTERYKHLNKSYHNHLRITRILRSIGYLGYQQLQLPWLEFILKEIRSENSLLLKLGGGSVKYWIESLIDSDDQVRALLLSTDDGSGTSTPSAEPSKPGIKQNGTRNDGREKEKASDDVHGESSSKQGSRKDNKKSAQTANEKSGSDSKHRESKHDVNTEQQYGNRNNLVKPTDTEKDNKAMHTMAGHDQANDESLANFMSGETGHNKLSNIAKTTDDQRRENIRNTDF